MICNRWDVVVVPFPFTDQPVHKRRPALVLSSVEFNRAGHSVLAMITTSIGSRWPGDVPIEDCGSAGLPRTSTVRLKLFTLDNRLIMRQIGAIVPADCATVLEQLHNYLP